jgi:hypothetical protein
MREVNAQTFHRKSEIDGELTHMKLEQNQPNLPADIERIEQKERSIYVGGKLSHSTVWPDCKARTGGRSCPKDELSDKHYF